MIRVDRVGLTTVQDEGRPGFAHLGVPTSGAADRRSFSLANRLAGNHATAAMFETSGGLVLTALRDVIIVLTGADSDSRVATRPLARCAAAIARAGDEVRIDRVLGGVRAYLAVSGGILGDDLLGSLSQDVLSGFVPVPLHEGAVLGVGVPVATPTSVDAAINPEPLREIRVNDGPHRERFPATTIDRLTRTKWMVSATSNRIAIRLQGVSIGDASLGEIPSVPLVRGAVQVTPGEELVVMLSDHPTTGGYPVIGVVPPDDLDRLSQALSGHSVRISWNPRGAEPVAG